MMCDTCRIGGAAAAAAVADIMNFQETVFLIIIRVICGCRSRAKETNSAETLLALLHM